MKRYDMVETMGGYHSITYEKARAALQRAEGEGNEANDS